MSTNLWEMPVPVTAIIRGPFFKVLLKRRCEISFSIEGENGGEKWLSLLFEGVEAFKATYLKALGSVDRELRKQAYGCLVSVEGSSWLGEVKKSYSEYCAASHQTPGELLHLMIHFDDGPCYEIICERFEAGLIDGVSEGN